MPETPFGDWVKRRRREFGYTQEELADRTGCSSATIRKIEGGQRRPSRQVAELLAACLEIGPDERTAFLRLARTEPHPIEQESTYLPGDGTVGSKSETSQPPASTPVQVQPQTNLPGWLTPLLGRDADVEAIRKRLLDDSVRLLTLVGPPGIGKTRLAVEAAHGLVNEYSDGVFFVDLSPVSDSGRVASTVGSVLGLKEVAAQSWDDQLRAYLAGSEMLLLLDNLEQVLEVGTSLVQLLSACPGLKLLVTSQAPLQLRVERQYPVSPLPIPDPSHLPPLDEVIRFPAVALYLERAQACNPQFVLNDTNAGAVARICSRLDGLPLAIELVAARSKILSPQAILQRLNNSLSLLTGGLQDLPPRQRTLRAAIGWSYNLLNEGEQTLLARMSVFVGGCSLGAAEAVCNARGDLPLDLLEGIGSLFDKSLLTQGISQREEPRFVLLQVIREYAYEQLEQRGDVDEMRRLHAEYYLALAEAASLHLRGKEQDVWLNLLETEHDNLRAAIDWASASGEHEIALRLVGALFRFWEVRGHYSEGRDRSIAALASAGALPGMTGAPRTAVRAKALAGAGRMVSFEGKLDEALTYHQESLAIYRELGGDKLGLARALQDMGNLHNGLHRLDEARAFYQEGLEYYREIGDLGGMGVATQNIAHLDWQIGDLEMADARYAEGVALHRKSGDLWNLAMGLNDGAGVAAGRGDFARARRLYEEALPLIRSLGSKLSVGIVLNDLGHLAVEEGNAEEARAFLREAMAEFAGIAEITGMAGTLWGWAKIAMLEENWPHAGVLLGASASCFEESKVFVSDPAKASYSANIERVRATLGDEAFAAAFAKGRAMTLRQAIDCALGGA